MHFITRKRNANGTVIYGQWSTSGATGPITLSDATGGGDAPRTVVGVAGALI